MRALAIAAALSLLTSAAHAAGWQDRITPADSDRLRRLDAAWTSALADARPAHAAELEALGALARRQPTLNNPAPPPGLYRCRTVKLGARGQGGLTFVAYGWFGCRVERTPHGELTLAKITGSQRTFGVLYSQTTKHWVYLGAQSWGTDETALAYGARPDRDQVGIVERIGAARWRLALPWPQYESKLDLIELAR